MKYMKISSLFIVLTIFLGLYSLILGNPIIFAQQNVKCPPGQIPVFVNNTPVIDPVTGQPQCSPITGLDPLGSIFGR